jgi:hypothetical protein
MDTADEQRPEQQGDPGPEQRGQKKAPGRPFTAGDPRINRQGRPRKDADDDPGEAVESPGDFDLLAQMEALLQRPKSQDRGEAQKGLRNWYEADVKNFMNQLAGLKREQIRGAGKGDAPADEPGEYDDGTEAALAVLDRVLLEIGVQENGGKR